MHSWAWQHCVLLYSHARTLPGLLRKGPVLNVTGSTRGSRRNTDNSVLVVKVARITACAVRTLQAQALEEQKEQEAAATARKAAVEGLASMTSEPLLLWQTAVRLVKMYTSAASVYVASIVDEEQPDWTPPEDHEADVETEDEDAAAAGDAAGVPGDAGAAAGEGVEGEAIEGEGQAGATDGTAGDILTQTLHSWMPVAADVGSCLCYGSAASQEHPRLHCMLQPA